MEHARPPAELSLEGGPATRSESWRKWRKLFEVFLKASGVSKEPKEVQASLLVNLIGPAGYEVYNTFNFAKGESEDDIQCVLQKFENHFGTKPNITVRRFKFFTRNQDERETIDEYVTALRLLSQNCEFGDLQESLLRDKIVCGITNNTVRDRLLRTDELTLAKAIQVCQAAEISKEEGLCIEGGSEEVQVNAVFGRGASRQRGGGSGGGARSRGGAGGWRGRGRAAAAAGVCARCAGARCAGDDRCPARDALCFACDRKGHFSRVCERKKTTREVLNLSVNSNESEYEEMFYVNTITADKKLSKSSVEWVENILCNGKQIIIKIDTGSMINVISKKDFLKIGLSVKQLKPFTKLVHSFTGNRLPIIGTDDLTIVLKNKTYVLPFVVADFKCQNVLGLNACMALGLINHIDLISLDKYSNLFHGLGRLPGKYSICIDKNVQPVMCPTRKIPLGLKDKLSVELKRMEELGVVRKVNHPTDWVNAIVLVGKKDGSIRVCLDPRPLNRCVRRAQFTLPTVTELAVRLRGATHFSVLDARCGFWMVQLDDASADLCTFSTPFGRYQFLRLPYGISCAPEVFHGKLRQHLEDLEGVESFIDDVIVWGQSKEEHDKRLESLLQRAQTIGIKFNRDKCKFGVPEITYLGHRFDANGMKADDCKVKAILEMPHPTDRKALERFLGMVNYLSKFIQNCSECVNVLRGLLKKDVEWVWESHHSKAVENLKRKVASAPVLSLYSPEAPVVLSVDASSVALGAVLLQNDRPVEFASLTLTETQTRYAQIEKEMLAIVFAVERFRQYIYGRSDVIVHSDHKPLEALFNKPLVAVPARLQRMMMRVQGFDIKVVYVPGKYMYIADTLSRAALSESMHERVSEDVDVQTCFMLENVPFSEVKRKLIKKETELDGDCRQIMRYIKNGWPKNRREISEKINVFWPYREQLHCMDGMIFKGECVFIPRSIRKDMLRRVHEGHLGIERCKRRAREVMFWPGMGEDVEREVRRCEACALHAPRPRRQPLAPHAVPSAPWHKLASDIFEYRRKRYIILVDYFSNYVEVGELTGITSKQVINFMKSQFARHGIPAELVTDNGPAYSSMEFKKFMQEWEVHHVTSSPHYPQSNGKSERTVQTIKNLLKKCIDSNEDFNLSLLNFRSTPRNGMDSPAQMLMGRRLNTRLPISSNLLNEPVDKNRNYQAMLTKRRYMKEQYDRSAQPLGEVSVGDKATLVCHGDRKPVTIVARAQTPRSFIVEDRQGNKFRRSRAHLVVRMPTGSSVTSPTPLAPSASLSFRSNKSPSCGFDPRVVPGIIRRRRNEVAECENKEQLQMTNTASHTPSMLDSSLSSSFNSRVSKAAPSPSPSPPSVPIQRSRERTARMLANYIFGPNEKE